MTAKKYFNSTLILSLLLSTHWTYALIYKITLVTKKLENDAIHYVWNLHDIHETELDIPELTKKRLIRDAQREIVGIAKKLDAIVYVEDWLNYCSDSSFTDFVYRTAPAKMYLKESPALAKGLYSYLKQNDVDVYSVENRHTAGVNSIMPYKTIKGMLVGISAIFGFGISKIVNTFNPFGTINNDTSQIAQIGIPAIITIPAVYLFFTAIFKRLHPINVLNKKMSSFQEKAKDDSVLQECLEKLTKYWMQNRRTVYHQFSLLNDIDNIVKILQQAENTSCDTHSINVVGANHAIQVEESLVDFFGYQEGISSTVLSGFCDSDGFQNMRLNKQLAIQKSIEHGLKKVRLSTN